MACFIVFKLYKCLIRIDNNNMPLSGVRPTRIDTETNLQDIHEINTASPRLREIV